MQRIISDEQANPTSRTGYTVLVVEDDPGEMRALCDGLELSGHTVMPVDNAVEAMTLFQACHPDLIILDLRLPGEMDGLEFLKELRKISDVPVVIVTGMGRVDDRVRGLDIGADDYIVKPFDVKEINARIQSVMRRVGLGGASVRKSGPIEINLSSKEVFVDGRKVHLSPMEYKLLTFFIEHQNKVLLHHVLLAGVWNRRGHSEYDMRTLRTTINRLRKKIEPDPSNPRFIVTKRGFGYMWVVQE